MIGDILKSLAQFTKHILFGKRPDVILFYPQHFNRSVDGTNLYFAPLVKLCRDNALHYLEMEEPDGGTPQPRDPQCMKADVFFWFVTALRKLIRSCNQNKSQVVVDKQIARVIDFLTFHKLRAKCYVTMSNSMIDVLAEINPEGIAYDYQHGIIYNAHEGYFVKKNMLTLSHTLANRRILLWGDMYKKCFTAVQTPFNAEKQIKVVGYPITTAVIEQKERKTIVICLQFRSEGSYELHANMHDMLCECLDVLKKYNYKVLLKHHPRFNDVYDLSDITQKYGFAEYTDSQMQELAEEAFLQITWNSTTIFEYANYSIPSFLLTDERLDWGETTFYRQYYYPLYHNEKLESVMERIASKESYERDCVTVKNWYDSAYAPFDKNLMLKILKGND